MKVIDLLNKIANGEEVPEKIKVHNTEYYKCILKTGIDYKIYSDDFYYLSNDICKAGFSLNDEVEIIEEQQMEEKLKKIINHYGIDKQLKYIHSEYFELDEAIIKYEDYAYENYDYGVGKVEWGKWREHIAEEIADVMVMLEQFRLYYDIPSMQITEIMQQKIERQLKRIEEE